MRKLVLFASLITVLFTSCGGCMGGGYAGQPYEYMQGPGGQQMVACYDNSGTRFMMDYLLFTSLMRTGGYGGVINHYHSYPTRFTPYSRAAYGNYRPFNGASYNRNSWGTYKAPSGGSTFRNTTPTVTKPASSWSSKPSTGSSFKPSPSTGRSSWSSPSRSSYTPRSSGSSFRSSSSSSSFRRR
jgi:hypothetical protein